MVKAQQAHETTSGATSLAISYGHVLARYIPPIIESYDAFIHQGPPHEPKEFAEWHQACRHALHHIEALMKLVAMSIEGGGTGGAGARGGDSTESAQRQQEAQAQMIRKAQQDLRRYLAHKTAKDVSPSHTPDVDDGARHDT
ncbi:MAG: hypothetical protein GDA54_01685 [Alphaproteobacteria bacterium GM7ARS4]|nr:hypothetical protein [Alphaproteobacteria bacterium GM7ARS4]